MRKYLVQGSYSKSGVKGLLKEGGSKRKALVESLIQNLGGTVECFYYCLGETDFVVICSLPERTSALAFSMAVKATGSANLSLLELIETPEIDKAAKVRVGYRAPGA